MWNARYWSPWYWAARYWAKIGQTGIPVGDICIHDDNVAVAIAVEDAQLKPAIAVTDSALAVC